jgi:hypothetical protein
MILMALDHTQDFFSAAGMNPRDVPGPALFTNSRSSSKPFGRRKYTLRSDREDQLLARLYGGKSVPGVIRLQARGSAPSSNSNRGDRTSSR